MIDHSLELMDDGRWQLAPGEEGVVVSDITFRDSTTGWGVNKLRKWNIVRNTKLLKFAEGVVAGLEFFADILEGVLKEASISRNQAGGTLSCSVGPHPEFS
ncbi:hypothetical protein HG530_010338 [Fusarium avenaceum]|nr:hypothetical protein HG530_010338 [Fusarium avenaceum]